MLGLSHIGLKALDIEKTCTFYRDFLGFAEQCRLNYLTTGKLMLVCFKVSEDQWIEVFTGWQPGENRMHQVAFRVMDADGIRVRLAEHGVAVPEKTPTGQMGNLNFVVSDPAGQFIEFVEHLPSGITARDRGKFLPSSRVSSHMRHARIVTPVLDRVQPFYDVLGLGGAVETPTAPGSRANGSIRRATVTGDFVEFVSDLASEAQFSLEVPDITEAKNQLERRPYRSHYSRPLALRTEQGGRRILELFDPDGTCVRLTEPGRNDVS